jgi:hypothetical protein
MYSAAAAYDYVDIAMTVVATAIALPILRFLYWLCFEPVDMFRSMDDVGYSNIKGNSSISKRALINRMRRNRKTGRIPPPFPNGWYVLQEGRSVSGRCEVQIYFHKLSSEHLFNVVFYVQNGIKISTCSWYFVTYRQ